MLNVEGKIGVGELSAWHLQADPTTSNSSIAKHLPKGSQQQPLQGRGTLSPHGNIFTSSRVTGLCLAPALVMEGPVPMQLHCNALHSPGICALLTILLLEIEDSAAPMKTLMQPLLDILEPKAISAIRRHTEQALEP